MNPELMAAIIGMRKIVAIAPFGTVVTKAKMMCNL